MPHLDWLDVAAQAGDNEARYILAQNLYYGFNSPRNEQSYEAKLNEVQESSDSDVAMERTEKRFEYCKGIASQEYLSLFAHLENAAHEDYVFALEAIGRITPEFFMKIQGYENLNREDYISSCDRLSSKK